MVGMVRGMRGTEETKGEGDFVITFGMGCSSWVFWVGWAGPTEGTSSA